MNLVETDVSKIKGNRVEFVNTSEESGHSNFRYLDGFSRQYNSAPYIPTLARVFSLARKLGFQGLLVDKIPCEESNFFREENQALKDKNIGYADSDVFKFSFFREKSEDRICPESFLGYTIFKIDRDTSGQVLCQHVFESVLPPPRLPLQNNFLHCQRRYRVANTLGEDFEVSGSLYAQQNGKTFVCAHVALRTLLACVLSEGDIFYQRIFQFTGKRSGLEPEDIEKVFNGLNLPFRKITFEPCPHHSVCPSIPSPEYMRELYGFTESACPALLGFELADHQGRHIVPILGHTFNEDSWVPPSNRGYFQSKNFRFFSSEQWLSSHLMHDDNFGPYYCLPRQFLTKENFRLLYGVHLEKHALFSIDAESTAIGLFQQSIPHLKRLSSNPATNDPWSDLFVAFASQNRLILRAVYILKEKYLAHLRNCNTNSTDDTIAVIEEVLPPKFWMVESSMQELFSISRKKFGELILLPHGEDVVFNVCSFICIRLPGCVIVRDEGDCGKWTSYASSIHGHTPLYSEESRLY